MSTWSFVNNANIPVNIGLFNAGILYHYKNNVQPFSVASCKSIGGALSADQWPGITPLKDKDGNTLVPSTDDGGCAAIFDVAAIGWDIAVVYSTPDNGFAPGQNWTRIVEYVGLTLGALTTVVGIAFIWVPGAGAALTAVGITITAGAIATIGAVATGVGTVLFLGDVAVSVAQTVMTPAKFISWSGWNDYVCTIVGGFEYLRGPDGKAPMDGKVHITGIDPLKLNWRNVDTGETGLAEAKF